MSFISNNYIHFKNQSFGGYKPRMDHGFMFSEQDINDYNKKLQRVQSRALETVRKLKEKGAISQPPIEYIEKMYAKNIRNLTTRKHKNPVSFSDVSRKGALHLTQMLRTSDVRDSQSAICTFIKDAMQEGVNKAKFHRSKRYLKTEKKIRKPSPAITHKKPKAYQANPATQKDSRLKIVVTNPSEIAGNTKPDGRYSLPLSELNNMWDHI